MDKARFLRSFPFGEIQNWLMGEEAAADRFLLYHNCGDIAGKATGYAGKGLESQQNCPKAAPMAPVLEDQESLTGESGERPLTHPFTSSCSCTSAGLADDFLQSPLATDLPSQFQ